MRLAPLLDELRAGKFLYIGSHNGAHGNGEDISCMAKDSKVIIVFKGAIFFYDIQLKYPPKHGERGMYSEPVSLRKMYQKQIYEAMKEGAKKHARLR